MIRRLTPLLGLAALVAAQPLHGQSKIGITAGVVSANLAYSGSTHDTKGLIGFAAGLTMASSVASNLTLNPELLYVQKGAASNTSGDDTKVKIGYIEVPILLRYAFGGDQASARPFVTAGLSVGFEASCRVTATVAGVSDSADCDATGDKLKSTDIGFVLGAGLQGKSLGASVRYQSSISDINDTPGSSLTVHNTLWAFMVSLRP